MWGLYFYIECDVVSKIEDKKGMLKNCFFWRGIRVWIEIDMLDILFFK